MKTFNMNKIDIKFIILGHDNVGKKSFVKKLHAMNSSDTKEIKKEYSLPDKAQIKKILFSKDNIFKDENELILYEKKLNKTKRICDFKKFINIEFNHIEISTCIINKPLPILISDNRNIIDDLESGEKQHNFKFQNVKTHLNQKINEVVKENKNRDFKTFIILLFMFDYSNLDSFEKIKFYYSEVSKMYKLEDISDSDFRIIPVFIGNKVDAKTVLPNDLKGIYEDYFKAISYKHYEISTAYYFNFERFFKLLFTDTILPLLPQENDYSKNIFMEKLETILFENKSFNKAEKHKLINNNVPGPEYDQETFSVSSKESKYY